jgi:hypothetical protein
MNNTVSLSEIATTIVNITKAWHAGYDLGYAMSPEFARFDGEGLRLAQVEYLESVGITAPEWNYYLDNNISLNRLFHSSTICAFLPVVGGYKLCFTCNRPIEVNETFCSCECQVSAELKAYNVSGKIESEEI